MKFRSTPNLLFRYLLSYISPSLAVRFLFLFHHRRLLHLDNPRTLDEKIQWLKINYYKDNELIKKCADKYAVREYIRECGLEHILIPLIGTYKSAGEVDWNALPERFVLKWNFGNGGNVICADKSALDIAKSTKDLNKFQKLKAHLISAEPQYDVKKVLLCEEYIGSENGDAPVDYKIYCFNGCAKFVLCCYGRGETGHPAFYIFNRNWELQRLNKQGLHAPDGFTMPKPDGMEKLFEYAEILSKPFPFVRADFYLVNGKPYFGELTFSPAGGFDTGRLPSSDLLYGDMVELPELNK